MSGWDWSGDAERVTPQDWQLPPQPPVSQPVPEWPPPPPTLRERLKRLFAPLAGVGALLAKFGAVLVKLKAFTVVGSMAVSVVAYATLWGWKFALGFVLLIFVHEIGHVIALRARGIPASAPVFLPFLGAFVSMKQLPRSAYEEAESAIAGPLTGTIGALAVAWIGHETGNGFWTALAFTGLFLNLFNLLPVLPLDGGRVAGALHPAIWLLGLVALVTVEVYRPNPVILIILVLGGYELWQRFRNRDSAASKVYFALRPGQRLRVGAAYLGLIAVILVGMHATYVERHVH